MGMSTRRSTIDVARQIRSASPTFCFLFGFRLGFSFPFDYRMKLLLRESPQGPAGLRMKPVFFREDCTGEV